MTSHTERLGFERAYRDYGDSLWRRALRYTGSPPDADDLASETWLQAMRSWQSFDSERGLWAWLVRIMKRAWWRSLNPKRTDKKGVETVSITEALAISVQPCQHEMAMANQVRERIALLSPKRAQAVSLYHDYGLETPEIAAINGTSQQAASDALRRGVAELLIWWNGDKYS